MTNSCHMNLTSLITRGQKTVEERGGGEALKGARVGRLEARGEDRAAVGETFDWSSART